MITTGINTENKILRHMIHELCLDKTEDEKNEISKKSIIKVCVDEFEKIKFPKMNIIITRQ